MPVTEPQEKHSFSHGIHPPGCKEATEGHAVRRLPFADEMIVPLSQHTGAPAKAIVREGQEVVRGEPIAEAEGFVSVPMHSPATGVVERIGPGLNARGEFTESIFIKLYPGASQEVLYGAAQDVAAMSPKELISAVQATGVVGLGGAAFPTHVKLAVPEGMSVDTVIVNGCECEPYLTTDHRVMLESIEDMLAGIRIVGRAVEARKAIIGIEDNKLDAVEAIRAALNELPAEGLPIAVEALQTKYPQGAEKMLTKALLNREIPSGGLPSAVGVAVFNVATLAQIGNLLPRRQGLIERVITITGPGVTRPGNYLIPLGTRLDFVLDWVGFSGDANQVILGGPMMGTSVPSLEIPITKGVTGILVNTRDEVARRKGKVFPCIKCGACLEACPMRLNPSRLGILARKSEYGPMEDQYHLNDCFECGCCSYVCPSNIPLVHYFRVAKGLNRDRKAQEALNRDREAKEALDQERKTQE